MDPPPPKSPALPSSQWPLCCAPPPLNPPPHALPPFAQYLKKDTAAKAEIENLKAQGAQMIIALTHMREYNDVQFLKDVPEVDLLLGMCRGLVVPSAGWRGIGIRWAGPSSCCPRYCAATVVLFCFEGIGVRQSRPPQDLETMWRAPTDPQTIAYSASAGPRLPSVGSQPLSVIAQPPSVGSQPLSVIAQPQSVGSQLLSVIAQPQSVGSQAPSLA